MGGIFALFIRLFGLIVIFLGFFFLGFGYFDEQYIGIFISLPVLWIGWQIFDFPTSRRLKLEAKIKALPEFSGADFSHVYSDTGLALNNSTQTIFLVAGDKQKLYSFADIRRWRYVFADHDIPSGAGLGQRAGIESRNADESGLFVEVKDINAPEWHIKFAYNSGTLAELKRWMEIMRQCVNNDR